MTGDEGNISDTSTTVTIVRDSPKDTQTRQIVVYLDGENRGELMFGDSMTLPLEPGPHTLRVDNTWKWKDVKLDVHAGEQFSFQTASSASQFSWFLLGFLGFGPYSVSIEPIEGEPIKGERPADAAPAAK